MIDQLRQYVEEFRRSIGKRGIVGTLTKSVDSVIALSLDFVDEKLRRSNTGGIIRLDSLEIDSPNKKHGVYYAPSHYRIVKKVFALLKTPAAESTLIDFGCGKGRVLLLAAEYGFKRALGVEFSEELYREAKGIIGASKHAARIELHHADAATFAIPDDANVFYFYNPFDAVVMSKVIANIQASLKKRPRAVSVIYVNAIHGKLFDDAGFKTVARDDTSVYVSVVYTA